MHNLEQLKVWHMAMEIARDVYVLTGGFPNEERFGLTSQVRRAAVSIASNIAEGAGRYSDKEFAHFLSIASGSSFEVRTQLLIAVNLNYITQEKVGALLKNLSELEKMIYGFRKTLKDTNP
jgi:four helix bundle protein